MRLKRLTQSSASAVTLIWDDGHESQISLLKLRDACPCASCQGETVLLKSYLPPQPDRSAPGRYVLTAVEPVGNYALKIRWGDGHETGIYTWEHIRSLCECTICVSEAERHQNPSQ